MQELGGELAWKARPSGLWQPVRTGLYQPRGGLLVGQASGIGA
jgi:hypothetical protein